MWAEMWDDMHAAIQAQKDLAIDSQDCEICGGHGHHGLTLLDTGATEILCKACLGNGVDPRSIAYQEANAMVLDMELTAPAAEDITRDAGDAVDVAFNRATQPQFRYVVATPENLIQAGRALADIADGETYIQRNYTSPRDGKLGVLLATPGDKAGSISVNAVLKYGTVNNINTWSVRKFNTRQDGKCYEGQHTGFNFRFNRNKREGYDPRFTVTKHCIAVLVLMDIQVVFVDPTGELLDAANCWQLIETGMEWEYTWLNSDRRIA